MSVTPDAIQICDAGDINVQTTDCQGAGASLTLVDLCLQFYTRRSRGFELAMERQIGGRGSDSDPIHARNLLPSIRLRAPDRNVAGKAVET
jgi:hypothetical protein